MFIGEGVRKREINFQPVVMALDVHQLAFSRDFASIGSYSIDVNINPAPNLTAEEAGERRFTDVGLITSTADAVPRQLH